MDNETKMKSSDTENNNQCINKCITVNDLPDEVLEFILSFLPPYKDLHNCLLVCKRWRSTVHNVVRRKRRKLQTSLVNFRLNWQAVKQMDKTPVITKRYSHAAVVHGDSMYVFGGCTNTMTTFNDLWRLDLSTRQWIRPLALGMYPTPKACSSMVSYKDTLVVFGGWAYPSTFPFHQTYQLFNELHVYNVTTNKWHFAAQISGPPPTAGHSASMHGSWMVLFGGMQRCSLTGNTLRSNDLWRMNLDKMVWEKYEPKNGSVPSERSGHLHVVWEKYDTKNGTVPPERYGHSQVALDINHALVLGGCGGPNHLFTDVWLLTMTSDLDEWYWRQMEVRGQQWAPADTWCHPACKVGNYVVVFNREPARTCRRRPPSEVRPPPPPQPASSSSSLPSPSYLPIDRDVNVNGRRGTLPSRRPDPTAPPLAPSGSSSSSSSSSSRAAGASRLGSGHNPNRMPVIPRDQQGLSLSAFNSPKPVRSQGRQHELLRRMEEFLRSRRSQLSQPERNQGGNLYMYLLDVTHALDAEQPYVTWVAPSGPDTGAGTRCIGPEDTLLYTLVLGKGELIMFGGIQKDNADAPALNVISDNLDHCSYATKVSNTVHFICAPSNII